ncbi:Hypothetical_protein [Hexamita inflata]|uniref:Hypothetical_protein n=1 Tax=Hexamita inflata TaxID=28002 RepID=A0AA86URV3_9EUKA|nr:Hypothetical protein HINF_LOCUS35508 [Hexamita inflata]
MHLNWQSGSGFAQSSPSSLLQDGCSPVDSDLHRSNEASQDSSVVLQFAEHVNTFVLEAMQKFAHPDESAVQPVQPLIERQLPLLFTSETHFLVASQAQHVAMEAVETHLSVFGSFLICAQTPLKQLESAPSTVHAWPAFFLQTNAVPSRDAVVPAEPQEIVSAEHLNKEDWITGQHLLEWQSEFWEHGSPLLGTQLTAPETSTVGIVFDKAGQSGSALLQRKSAESFSFMHLNWQSGSGFAQSSPSSLLQDGCSPVDSDLHRSNEASQDSSVVLQFAEHVNTFVLEAMQKFAHPDESAVQTSLAVDRKTASVVIYIRDALFGGVASLARRDGGRRNASQRLRVVFNLRANSAQAARVSSFDRARLARVLFANQRGSVKRRRGTCRTAGNRVGRASEQGRLDYWIAFVGVAIRILGARLSVVGDAAYGPRDVDRWYRIRQSGAIRLCFAAAEIGRVLLFYAFELAKRVWIRAKLAQFAFAGWVLASGLRSAPQQRSVARFICRFAVRRTREHVCFGGDAEICTSRRICRATSLAVDRKTASVVIYIRDALFGGVASLARRDGGRRNASQRLRVVFNLRANSAQAILIISSFLNTFFTCILNTNIFQVIIIINFNG